MLQGISIERLIEIEEERSEVMGDRSFQTWVRDLNVSRLSRRHIDRASEVMSHWTDRHGERNTFDYLIKTK
jgi:hypothetical protein